MIGDRYTIMPAPSQEKPVSKPVAAVTVTVTPTPDMNAELAAAACERYRKVADVRASTNREVNAVCSGA